MKAFLKSFLYAFNGIKVAFAERNFRIHLFVGLLTLIAAFYFKISNLEFIAIIFAIFLVITAELLNTIIEIICNIVRDKMNLDYEATKIPRDLGAAFVLLNVFCAVIIGIIVFLPKILII